MYRLTEGHTNFKKVLFLNPPDQIFPELFYRNFTQIQGLVEEENWRVGPWDIKDGVKG